MSRISLRGLRARISPAEKNLLDRVLAAANRSGRPVYLVGGPVRDLLLEGRCKDLDLCVESDELAAAGELAEAAVPRGGRVVRHPRFGTATLEWEGAHLDLAATRSETYKSAGALPQPRSADLATDLRRRDFSVNAMALPLSDPARRKTREVIDPFDGQRDLARGILRTLHPESFHDDPTRALRAARFIGRFAKRLEPTSRHDLHRALRDGALAQVSGARLRREFEKLGEDGIAGARVHRTLIALQDWHVLSALEPGLAVPSKARTVLRRASRYLAEPAWEPRGFRPWPFIAKAWLAFASKAQAEGFLSRLSVAGKSAAELIGFREGHKRLLRAVGRAHGRGEADAILAECTEEALAALYCLGELKVRRRIARFAREDRDLELPLTGRDLVDAGLSGRDVGEALKRLRALFLDGRLRHREEAIALALELPRK